MQYVLNQKLKVKIESKRFIDFWNCCILLSSQAPLPTLLVLLQAFAYRSSNCVT